MADISAAVGSGGKNLGPDVLEVQTLLNRAPIAEGGPNPPIDMDGWGGNGTVAAIKAFQKRQFGFQDGRVDPGKKTITRLNELASGPGARTVLPPDRAPAELAKEGIQQASIWGNSGLAAVTNALRVLDSSGTIAGLNSIVLIALAGHFKLTPGLPTARLKEFLGVVRRNFTGALQTLARASQVFVSVSRKQASLDQAPGAPGYTRFGETIRWTPFFHTWVGEPPNRPGLNWNGSGEGPKCRAAMVLHEPIHNVDVLGKFDIYEHGPGYLTMRPEQAVHNAASYPSFAAHVFERSTTPLGPRYGAGRISE